MPQSENLWHFGPGINVFPSMQIIHINSAFLLEVGRRGFLPTMVSFMASEIKEIEEGSLHRQNYNNWIWQDFNSNNGNWATSMILKDCLNHLEDKLIPEHYSKPTEQEISIIFHKAFWMILIQVDKAGS